MGQIHGHGLWQWSNIVSNHWVIAYSWSVIMVQHCWQSLSNCISMICDNGKTLLTITEQLQVPGLWQWSNIVGNHWVIAYSWSVIMVQHFWQSLSNYIFMVFDSSPTLLAMTEQLQVHGLWQWPNIVGNQWAIACPRSLIVYWSINCRSMVFDSSATLFAITEQLHIRNLWQWSNIIGNHSAIANPWSLIMTKHCWQSLSNCMSMVFDSSPTFLAITEQLHIHGIHY